MHQQLGTTEEERAPLLVWLGVALLVAGVLVALFVAAEVLAVYRYPDSNQFITYLNDRLVNSELFLAGAAVVIGDGGATITAFVLFSLIAWIGAGIAFSFVRAGHQLSSGYIALKVTAAKARMEDNARAD